MAALLPAPAAAPRRSLADLARDCDSTPGPPAVDWAPPPPPPPPPQQQQQSEGPLWPYTNGADGPQARQTPQDVERVAAAVDYLSLAPPPQRKAPKQPPKQAPHQSDNLDADSADYLWLPQQAHQPHHAQHPPPLQPQQPLLSQYQPPSASPSPAPQLQPQQPLLSQYQPPSASPSPAPQPTHQPSPLQQQQPLLSQYQPPSASPSPAPQPTHQPSPLQQQQPLLSQYQPHSASPSPPPQPTHQPSPLQQQQPLLSQYQPHSASPSPPPQPAHQPSPLQRQQQPPQEQEQEQHRPLLSAPFHPPPPPPPFTATDMTSVSPPPRPPPCAPGSAPHSTAHEREPTGVCGTVPSGAPPQPPRTANAFDSLPQQPQPGGQSWAGMPCPPPPQPYHAIPYPSMQSQTGAQVFGGAYPVSAPPQPSQQSVLHYPSHSSLSPPPAQHFDLSFSPPPPPPMEQLPADAGMPLTPSAAQMPYRKTSSAPVADPTTAPGMWSYGTCAPQPPSPPRSEPAVPVTYQPPAPYPLNSVPVEKDKFTKVGERAGKVTGKATTAALRIGAQVARNLRDARARPG